MAYELLVGHGPWPDTAGESLPLVLSILDDAPIDDAPLREACPGRVADVVRRALAKDRSQRFASMAEIVEALARPWEAADPDASRGRASAKPRWPRVVLAAGLTLGSIGAAVWMMTSLRSNSVQQPALVAPGPLPTGTLEPAAPAILGDQAPATGPEMTSQSSAATAPAPSGKPPATKPRSPPISHSTASVAAVASSPAPTASAVLDPLSTRTW
jgi:hypothetical protein